MIDNYGLKQVFVDYGIDNMVNFPNLSAEDVIHKINMCLKSDAVYVCNSNGELDNCTMLLLGYLMAMNQEIFFWSDIDKSEWLMSCILKRNTNGYQEVVQFPLEIVRSFAYPYLLKKFLLVNMMNS